MYRSLGAHKETQEDCAVTIQLHLVIASKAKQSRHRIIGKYSKTEISQTRLLRRYAPRNDEEGVFE